MALATMNRKALKLSNELFGMKMSFLLVTALAGFRGPSAAASLGFLASIGAQVPAYVVGPMGSVREYAMRLQERFYINQFYEATSAMLTLQAPPPPWSYRAIARIYPARLDAAASKSVAAREVCPLAPAEHDARAMERMAAYVAGVENHVYCCFRSHAAGVLLWGAATTGAALLARKPVAAFARLLRQRDVKEAIAQLTGAPVLVLVAECGRQFYGNCAALSNYHKLGDEARATLWAPSMLADGEFINSRVREQLVGRYLEVNRTAAITPDVVYWLGRFMFGEDQPRDKRSTVLAWLRNGLRYFSAEV